ncbi:MAG TPA: hypothetical protein VMH49_02240 [Thermoplasmata archaeon]|nr:hypothetical protein [Thermoplasmata archaeon]
MSSEVTAGAPADPGSGGRVLSPTGPSARSVAAGGIVAVVGALVGAAVLGSSGPVGSLVGPGAAVVRLLCSPVFLAILGGELLAGGLWASRREPWRERLLFVAPGTLVLGGLAGTLDGTALRIGYVLAASVLVLWFTYLLQHVYRHKQLSTASMRYVLEVAAAAVVVGAGWLLWTLDGSPVVWAASAFVPLAVLARAVGRRSAPGPSVPWLLHPGWATQLLLYTFLAEFFLGAVLDLEIAGRGFLQYIPFLPVGGGTTARLGLSVYDGLWFGAAILASAWFLVAVGATMGGLVLLRLREVHVPAQRYRMVLMLGVYALAVVYVPSLASSTPIVSNRTLATLPVIGWGFGLRSGGPFESGIFLAVLVMYASVGVLTVLFGRKALCAVMCGAALMYQGTTMHEMRQFNQSSRVGRYLLGSRLSSAYVVASSLALVSLFAVSVLSLLHRLPTVQVANGQYDTSALPLPIELYFGGLWFAMFVSTPYVGTYNCATTGVCHWGSLSVPFAKVGLYRLRVRDRKVCERCTTFDCAKACPVGLVDMPLHFRTKGEFRSTKCCGVGDCIGACPYGNLYDQDVRAWIARAFRRLNPRAPAVPLPMITGASKATAPAESARSLP